LRKYSKEKKLGAGPSLVQEFRKRLVQALNHEWQVRKRNQDDSHGVDHSERQEERNFISRRRFVPREQFLEEFFEQQTPQNILQAAGRKNYLYRRHSKLESLYPRV